MPLEDAIKRYLERRAPDTTENSVTTWRYQLKLFAEWCADQDIDEVSELRGYDLDDYYGFRAADVAPATLEGDMWTLRGFLKFLEQREAVQDGLAEKVRIPDVDDEDRSSDLQLAADEAIRLLRHFRTTQTDYGTRNHVFLELAWITGARLGGIRALDLRDVQFDEDYVEFRHRSETGTPLKNKLDGERPVGVTPEVSDALEHYIKHYRVDRHDEHGRAPLLTTLRGRAAENSVRAYSYLGTQPCLYRECPHDRERETCEYTERNLSSKCPSSRSPHPVRTGSISWQLDAGLPPWVVAKRANASVDVIEQHYDVTSPRERMERRRRPFLNNLQIEDSDHDPE